jgi:hypothetical protein
MLILAPGLVPTPQSSTADVFNGSQWIGWSGKSMAVDSCVVILDQHSAKLQPADRSRCGVRFPSVDTQNRPLIDTTKPAIN